MFYNIRIFKKKCVSSFADPVYHFSWGTKLNPVADAGSDSVKYIAYASLPCKSGSGLLFVSSLEKTGSCWIFIGMDYENLIACIQSVDI